MTFKGVKLNGYQTNLIKELMGDVFMTDTRAGAMLAQIEQKYQADILGMVAVASKPFEGKNAEFKRLEAEELAKDV